MLPTAKTPLLRFPLALTLSLGACQPAGGPTEEPSSEAAPAGTAVEGERIDFLAPVAIGDPPESTPPWITHLEVVDLDQDGRLDVVLTEASRNDVRWIRQAEPGVFEERSVGSAILGPAHVTASDVDLDGDIDLLVAEMGQIFPSNEKIGAVVLLENVGNEQFEPRVLLENVARVSDVEPGDLDNDGDVDLAVGQFGYDDGEIRWLENVGERRYESHQLLNLPGTIHVPVADMDDDGDLDIVAVVSQTWEQIYVFENDGSGGFTAHIVYGATNPDFGSSGISLADLDEDGDLDVLYTNGDAFDHVPPTPRPWHGVQWLENRGALDFAYHRIGDFPGAYSARAADADGDGDLDVFAVSLFADWTDENAQSFVWFENDGEESYTRRDIASTPTHLVVLDDGDLDGDGLVDFVTGGLYAHEPYRDIRRVTWWRNRWPERR